MNLLEGGNVFKDATGKPLTQRINSADVPGTIKWLEKLTKLDLTGKEKDKNGVPARWLGSTGRRDTSGDLDIALDANIVSKEQLNTFLTQWATKNNLDPAQFIKKAGELHFRTPINGDPKQGFVQTDFNFYPDPKALTWGTFYMSGSSANYKGMARNVLLSSLAKQQGLKIGGNGIVSRTTNKLIANGQDPDLAAQMVLGPGKTRNDLATVETIYANLARDPERDAKLADFREYLAREGLAEPTLKEENEVNFMARLRDRIVNQGMYTLIEAAAPAVSGGHAKGIEHLEDYVFRNGSAGITKALAIAEHAIQELKSTSAKWDGIPAIVWGRDPDGAFVLTDVSGFTAKGYEGLARSPRQISDIMVKRDTDAAAKGDKADRVEKLLPIYTTLWPLLSAATPEKFRGYVQGDLLYMTKPPLEAGAYVFKPNTVEYRIPASSDVGKQIAPSNIGIAIHTRYAEPGAPKEPVGNIKFNPVPGLLLLPPVFPKENIAADNKLIKSIKALNRQHGADIDQLFNPADLRTWGITNFPVMCVDYINSLVKNPNVSSFDINALLPNFGEYLETKFPPKIINYIVKNGDTAISIATKYGIDPDSLPDELVPGEKITITAPASKFRHIVEYLQSPRSNTDALAAAFTAFVQLHALNETMRKQWDLQHPGQEGWVMATPHGYGKSVDRFGFSRANAARNNPPRA